MNTFLRNFLTTLKRFKTASVLNILGLSAAFAAFVLILMQVDYERSFDKFHPKSDRIYRVEISSPRRNIPAGLYAPTTPFPLAEAIRAAAPQVERVAVLDGRQRPLNVVAERGGDRTVYEEVTREISPAFLDVFDVPMADGDAAHSMQDRGMALIPESMARKFFGDEQAVGKLLAPAETDSLVGIRQAVRVGGVYRDFPRNSVLANDIYLPVGDEERGMWHRSNYHTYVQLSSPDAREAVAQAINRLDYPGKDSLAQFRLTLVSDIYYAGDILQDNVPKGSKTSADILLAIAVLVILIAGINFVNFSMALTPVRIKNINTRKILGSPVAALRTAMVGEAAATAVIAYGIALAVVFYAGQSSFAQSMTASLRFGDNGGILLLGAAIALFTGGVAGVYPAFYSTSFPPALVIKGNFGLSPKGRALRGVLVGFQFSVSIALIICAVFMNMQNSYLSHRYIGMDRGGIVEVPLSKKIFADRQSFVNAVGGDPAVTGVSLSMAPMFQNSYDNWGLGYKGEIINFGNLAVTSGFTDLMNIPIAEGRGFTEEDDREAPGAKAIFNQAAQKAYGIEVGEKLEFGAGQWIEIVGIMEDANFESLHKTVGPFALMNVGSARSSWLPTAYIRIRTDDPSPVLDRIGKAVGQLDPNALVDVHFLDATVEAQYRNDKRMGMLITVFSLLAIIISMAGIFGLVLFESQYRTKEIGVRRVNGATVADILGMLNKGFVRTVAVCFVIAAPAAWFGVERWMESFAYRIPLYWWVFALSLVVVLVVTLVTVTVQSWRAATANPVVALKSE